MCLLPGSADPATAPDMDATASHIDPPGQPSGPTGPAHKKGAKAS
jgi:hypothetical protein